MYTSCPSCHTVFRIHPDQLGVANGLVRCGVCDESFLALGRLYERLDDVPGASPPEDVVAGADEQGESAPLSPSAPAPAESETVTQEEHITAAAVPPRVPESLPAEPVADQSASVDESAAFDVQHKEPVVPQGFALDEGGDEPDVHLFADDMPPILKADLEAEAQRRRPGVVVLGTFAALILLAGLGVQYVYYQRDTLAQIPALRPWLVRLCGAVGCELPLPRDPQRIELLARDVHSDPNADNALLISATFVNRAPYRQAYPLLGVQFSNLSGTLIAARYFRPSEYLPADTAPDSGIAAGATVHVTLAVSDPGNKAVSYQFDFH